MSKDVAGSRRKLLAVMAAWMMLAAPGSGQQLVSEPQSVNAEFNAPALEVVSVKRVKDSGGWQSVGLSADGFNAKDAQLWLLIRIAFGAEFSNSGQIVGEPGWSREENYDIQARVSETDLGKLRNLNHVQSSQMTQAWLQTVLVDRFKLKFHQEDREGPVYSLVVAKSGPKLKQASAGEAGGLTVRPGQCILKASPLADLAKALTSASIGRIVVDQTGLTGRYDFTLNWTPDQGVVPPGRDGGPPPNSSWPSIFTAVEEQLGLKLEPGKGTVRTLVIDHIERPSEN
jgi:uncharacterized protein (TIGR03435 family)